MSVPADHAANEALRLRIHEDDMQWVFSRSGGPGGQNVNKVNTRVTLVFDLDACTALADQEKQRIRSRLRSRISRDGLLRLVSARYRSQSANRRDAIDRFYLLLAGALHRPTPRRPTKIPKRARERRLADKSTQAERKRLRRTPTLGGE